MDEAKRERLEAAGWRIGDYADFLGLSEAERQHVELRLALSRAVRRLRAAKGLTQKALGKLIESTQARVAKVETGTIEVSLDLMFRAFFAAGGRLADLNGPLARPILPEEAAKIVGQPRPRSGRKAPAKQGG